MTVSDDASRRNTDKTRSHAAAASANQTLFGLAVTVLGVAIIGSIVQGKMTLNGIDLKLSHSDIPLLLGLLVVFIGNFGFYKRLIEPEGEPPAAALLSLGGMLVMAALPIIILVERMLQFRYLMLALYAILIAIKNVELSSRFSSGDINLVFRIWKRRASLHAVTALFAGGLFWCLIDTRGRLWLFSKIIDCPNLSFKPAYGFGVNMVFNCALLLSVGILFVLHHKDLADLDLTRTNP
jgi:hypothetical protein